MKITAYLKQAVSIVLLSLGAIGVQSLPAEAATASAAPSTKPTIVLVHGAWSGNSAWDSVIPKLQADGYTVIAAANPLRDLKGDSVYVAGIVKNVKGPVILVGHSYGGSVITNAAYGADNVKALVYVAAYAPEAGENAFDLTGKFPGSTLPAALAQPIALPDGAHDLYVQQDKFRAVFAADVSEQQGRLLGVTQRPVTDKALKDPSATPAWKDVPCWFIYGSADKVIPPALHAFMAQRANAKQTVVVKGAPHLVMVSHSAAVADLIEKAAAATAE